MADQAEPEANTPAVSRMRDATWVSTTTTANASGFGGAGGPDVAQERLELLVGVPQIGPEPAEVLDGGHRAGRGSADQLVDGSPRDAALVPALACGMQISRHSSPELRASRPEPSHERTPASSLRRAERPSHTSHRDRLGSTSRWSMEVVDPGLDLRRDGLLGYESADMAQRDAQALGYPLDVDQLSRRGGWPLLRPPGRLPPQAVSFGLLPGPAVAYEQRPRGPRRPR